MTPCQLDHCLKHYDKPPYHLFWKRCWINKQECGSYRPISLLNVDSKIFAKMIARRLEAVLPTIISPDQTGFIKNRQSSSNIRRLYNIIYGSSPPDRPLYLLMPKRLLIRRSGTIYFIPLKDLDLGQIFYHRLKSYIARQWPQYVLIIIFHRLFY